MQENITIARPYAKAAFKQATVEDALDQWAEMLGLLRLLISDPQAKYVLANPILDVTVKVDFITGICEDYNKPLSESGSRFVRILAYSKRILLIPQIAELYIRLCADTKGILKLIVTSAYELSPDQLTFILNAIAKYFDSKITIASKIDRSLIGGIIIQAGDIVIDASIQEKLKKMAIGLST